MSSIKCCMNGKPLNFLIDTGASLCAIKYECLNSSNRIYEENLEIRGIGGYVSSVGYIFLNLELEGVQVEIKFYVFKDLLCKTDGIIGHDF